MGEGPSKVPSYLALRLFLLGLPTPSIANPTTIFPLLIILPILVFLVSSFSLLLELFLFSFCSFCSFCSYKNNFSLASVLQDA